MSEPARQSIPQNNDRRWCREDKIWTVLLTLVALIVLYYNLAGDRTLSSHEGYAVVPAQEMLQTEDWMVPRFGGIARLEKPPLAYWVIAAVSSLQGHVTVFSARFPATLAALGIALLMGHWAAQWYGRSAGYCAVLIQLTSAYQLMYCRKAEVDMLLLLLIVGALYLVANQPEQETARKSFLRWIGIYALIAISWLAKFHYGPVMILAPTIVIIIVQKQWSRLWQLLNPVGLLLVAAAVFLWPAMVLHRLPDAWDIWQTETLGRAVGTMGSNSPLYYLPYVLWLPLPWTLHAAVAMPSSWRRAWQDGYTRDRFLWIWLLVPLLILQMSANKHKHYLNAMLPVFTLWAAPVLATTLQRIRSGELRMNKLLAWGSTAGVIGLAVAGTSLIWHKWPHLMPIAFAMGTTILIVGCMAIMLYYYQKPICSSVAILGLCLALYICAYTWLVPAHDYRMADSRFSQSVRTSLGWNETLYTYGVNREPFIYYLGTPVRRTLHISDFKKTLAHKRSLHVVVFADALPELRGIGNVKVLSEMNVLPHEAEPRHPPLVCLQIEDRNSSFSRSRLADKAGSSVQ